MCSCVRFVMSTHMLGGCGMGGIREEEVWPAEFHLEHELFARSGLHSFDLLKVLNLPADARLVEFQFQTGDSL